MADIKSFAEAKANKNRDSCAWTPLECLKALMRDIEAGEVKPEKLCVHFFEEPNEETGRTHHGFYASGLSFPDHISLLHVAMARTLEDWRS